MSQRRIIRRAEVEILTGLSHATIYRKLKDQAETFPKPIRLGANSTGWFEDEVLAWLESRRVTA